MKKIGVILTILIMTFTFSIALLQNVYAVETKNLNIQSTRPFSADGISSDTTVGDDRYTFEKAANTLETIWKIYDIYDKDTSNNLRFEKAMYCLRGGLGFGSGSATATETTYSKIGNMKLDANAVLQKYNSNTSINLDRSYSTTINGTSYNFTPYNAILWIADNMYLPTDRYNSNNEKIYDAEEYKADLIEKAGIINPEITKDDIEVIQQMALWYFANYDTNGQTGSFSLVNSANLGNKVLVNNENLSGNRANQTAILYAYFINNAIKNSATYGTENDRTIAVIEPQLSIDETNPKIEQNGNFYVAGPFKVSTTEGNVDYAIDKFELKDADGVSIEQNISGVPIYSIVQKKTDTAVYKSSLKDTVGAGEFYIKISNTFARSYDLSEMSLNLNYSGKYYNTISTLWAATNSDQPVLMIEKEKKPFSGADTITTKEIAGNLKLVINKIDENNNAILSDSAKFTINREGKARTDYYTTNNNSSTGTVDGTIEIQEPITAPETFIYEIQESEAPEGYTGVLNKLYVQIATGLNAEKTAYEVKSAKLVKLEDGAYVETTVDGVAISLSADKTTITVKVVNNKIKYFDLALRKYITKINNTELTRTETRIPSIVETDLRSGMSTTANYNHKKNPVIINTNDIVTYNITIYNEGEIAGKATKVVDQLPTGLEFVEVVSGDYTAEYDEELNKVTFTQTSDNANLAAYDGTTLDKTTIEIKCKVIAEVANDNKVLTNVAWISEDYNADDNTITDRDSEPTTSPEVNKDNMTNYTGNNNKSDLEDSTYYYKGQQDDDDFEKLVLEGKYFDLSLRKYITKINGEELLDDDSRIPDVDTSKLKTLASTTATYSHSKEPVVVKKGDIVTYKIRVYNEGKRNGYATEITDYLPEGLGLLLNYNTNLDNLWHIDANAKTIDLIGNDGFYSTGDKVKNLKAEDFADITDLSDVKIAVGELGITTKSLDDEIIKAYNKDVKLDDIEEIENWQQSTNGDDGLYYQEVEVVCIVLKDNTFTGILTNIAEISKAEDENGNAILNEGDDRDSIPNNVDTENYNPPADNSSYQEDDDDYEPLVLKYFDLALRKFITKIENTDITTRIPEVSVDKDGNVSYYHDKTPLYVANSDIVTYTIRIYNEGSIDGYAEIVSDDIPGGLEFLPNNETNKKYIWKMYYEENGKFVETDDVEKATSIRTTYLSEANGEITNIISEQGTEQKNSNLLKGFDRTNMDIPDYRDIQVEFKAVEKDIPETNTDRIIINKAQISEDSDDDEDSIPDEWNEGEDDQDKEYIYLKEFDLSLLKWVTKSIVLVDGKTTTTETGFAPNIGKTEYTAETFTNIRNNEIEEPIAKVEINRRKIKSTVVDFVYKIRVTNEGELEGYATEVTDYIPEGLEFIEADNPIWKKDGDNKVITRALETTLLKPGESAELEIKFRWINGENNLGQKINVAEISEDYNEKDAEDIDSVPDTVKIKEYSKEIEDDDDYALVLLSISTGENKITTGYTIITLTVLAIITTGVVLIKKYVL